MRESVPNSASSFTPPSLRRGSRSGAQSTAADVFVDQQEENFISDPFEAELEDYDQLSDIINDLPDNEEQHGEDEFVENVRDQLSDSSSSDIDISSDETEGENGGVPLIQEPEQASNLVEDVHATVHESELSQEQAQVEEDVQDPDGMLVDEVLDVDTVRRAPLLYDYIIIQNEGHTMKLMQAQEIAGISSRSKGPKIHCRHIIPTVPVCALLTT
jgi:hypothetical protein